MRLPFVAKVMPDGRRLVYSVTLGTRIQDATVNQVAVDRSGGVVAVGFANDLYPLTSRTLVGSGATFVFKLDTGNFPTLVQSGNNPAGPGQPITLTATVLNPTPGGVVTFKDQSVTLGMSTVTGGIATITVTFPPGVHSITASNSADSKMSPPLFQLVRGQ